LLLRSPKDTTHPTQIDVVFFAVGSLLLPTVFNGLTIAELSSADSPPRGIPAPSVLLGDRTYVLTGEGWQGIILAESVSWLEDHSDDTEKSKLFI
jgi:hypothetical protein